MRFLHCVFACLIALLSLVAAQGQNNINVPSGGFNFTAGQSATITWANPSSRTVTIQLVPSSGVGIVNLITSVSASSLTATFTIPSNALANVYYSLKIIDDSNSSNVNISPAFFIAAGPAVTATSTSLSSGVTQSTSSTVSAASASSTTTSSQTSSFSTGAIIGVAIGGGVVGFAICGLIFYLMRRHRRRKLEREQERLQFSVSAMHEQPYPPHQASYSSVGGISGHPPPAPEYPYSSGTAKQTHPWSPQGPQSSPPYHQESKSPRRPSEIHRTITEVTGSSRHPSELDSVLVKSSHSRSPPPRSPEPRSGRSDQSSEMGSM